MIVVMENAATEQHINAVLERLSEYQLKGHLSSGEERTIIGVVGASIPATLREELEHFAGVSQTVSITRAYKLASREFCPQNTVVDVGGVKIGDGSCVVMAGPCSVESEEQIMASARAVREAGAHILRGGAFKPRSSPYAFRGLGEQGLQLLAQARTETGMPIVTEVMTPSDVDLVGKYADMFQIGARNAQNYQLLEEVGRTQIPVLLKRGLSTTIEEWLLSAEYIMAQGNKQVDLKDGAMHITFHPVADHAVSVTHPAEFVDGTVENALPARRREGR
ncbi:MAG: 3-deoxy-7-phosphoheptulonate synthase, partial [Chloroflexaceae bacterium]|nr:3-deoxy-7-phosphoheptulonate synthase [Chloroflexaceae bacterium]